MSETSVKFWAIRTSYRSTEPVPGPPYVMIGVRPNVIRRDFHDKWEAHAFARDCRRRWPNESYTVVRITRKPRLSPEAKAARDAEVAALRAAMIARDTCVVCEAALVPVFRDHCNDCVIDSSVDLNHEDLRAEHEWTALLDSTAPRAEGGGK